MSSVDVVVPCYGYGHFLRECVASVLSHSAEKIRVLIIDDASLDDTPDVGRELEIRDDRVTFLRHPTNKGHIYTYNEGIEWAAASYMLILSADDYLLPGALQRATTLMDQCPEAGFSFGNLIQLGEDGNTIEVTALKDLPQNKEGHILTGAEFIEASGATNIVGAPTAVVRTSLQKKVGGYRRELPHTGDMEMWLRLAACAPVAFVNAYQAVYRRHSSNMSKSYVRLADVQQRKLALHCFFQDSGSKLRNARRVRSRIYRLLACEAIGFASSAFNESDTDSSDQLYDFALSTSSGVKTSWPWIKFQCKRAMGVQAWNLLQGTVNRCRKAATF